MHENCVANVSVAVMAMTTNKICGAHSKGAKTEIEQKKINKKRKKIWNEWEEYADYM